MREQTETLKLQPQAVRFHKHSFWFVVLFFVGGMLRTFDFSHFSPIDTPAFFLRNGIFVGLVIYWILSVRVRLLPSRSRTYILIAGSQMLFLLFLQILKYRVITDDQVLLTRYAWYLYYVPILLIPSMFAFACLESFGKPGEEGLLAKKVVFLFLYLITGIPVAAVVTNDLHHLVFLPNPGITEPFGKSGTYTHGLLFYILYVMMFFVMIGGISLLLYQSRRTGGWKDALYFFFFPLLWGALLIGSSLFQYVDTPLRYPYEFQQIHVFCLIGMFESCIRSRLMPSNEEGYQDFFWEMKVPAIITDNDLKVLYQTGEPMPEKADSQALRDSLSAPVRLDGGFTLQGRRLSNALVFWASDERTLERLNKQLTTANEILSGENELIEAENRLKEKRARVEVRNRIYSRVSNRMLSAMKRLSDMLDLSEAERKRGDTDRFHIHMAHSLVITAYIKRASNLMLSDPGEEMISGRELKLAIEESARYLAYCKITVQIPNFSEQTMMRETAFSLYTAFEEWMESWLLTEAKGIRMSVACNDGKLRIMSAERTDTPDPVAVVKTENVLVTSEVSEGVLFVTMEVKET